MSITHKRYNSIFYFSNNIIYFVFFYLITNFNLQANCKEFFRLRPKALQQADIQTEIERWATFFQTELSGPLFQDGVVSQPLLDQLNTIRQPEEALAFLWAFKSYLIQKDIDLDSIPPFFARRKYWTKKKSALVFKGKKPWLRRARIIFHWHPVKINSGAELFDFLVDSFQDLYENLIVLELERYDLLEFPVFFERGRAKIARIIGWETEFYEVLAVLERQWDERLKLPRRNKALRLPFLRPAVILINKLVFPLWSLSTHYHRFNQKDYGLFQENKSHAKKDARRSLLFQWGINRYIEFFYLPVTLYAVYALPNELMAFVDGFKEALQEATQKIDELKSGDTFARSVQEYALKEEGDETVVDFFDQRISKLQAELAKGEGNADAIQMEIEFLENKKNRLKN